MSQVRVIPVLLLSKKGLVKTEKFAKPKYVGDPINAIRIFNEKEVDELIVLDIDATKNKQTVDFELLKGFASECFMPLCYGGGVKDLQQMEQIFSAGVEKISINSTALNNPEFIGLAAKTYGSQSIVVSIDVKKNLFGKNVVYSHCRGKTEKIEPVEFACIAENFGAGEILLNSVDKDGTRSGYDLDLIDKVSNAISIPLIACGGASCVSDFQMAINVGASAVAAGSMFVFHGKHKAVLINYPSMSQLKDLGK